MFHVVSDSRFNDYISREKVTDEEYREALCQAESVVAWAERLIEQGD